MIEDLTKDELLEYMRTCILTQLFCKDQTIIDIAYRCERQCSNELSRRFPGWRDEFRTKLTEEVILKSIL